MSPVVTDGHTPPRVFVSYDTRVEKTCDFVHALTHRLREDGVDAHAAVYEQSPDQGWPAWREQQIYGADFVLVVCGTRYRRHFDGVDTDEGIEIQLEGRLLRQRLAEAPDFVSRMLAVCPPGSTRDDVPQLLRASTPYPMTDEANYEALYRLLTGQPAVPRPSLGSIEPLPDAAVPALAKCPPDAQTYGSWSTRRTAMVVSGLLGVLGLVTAALMIWPWGAPPALPSGGLLVTAPRWSSAEVAERHDALCHALLEQQPDRVKCPRVSWWNADPSRYRDWALGRGATIAIHVSDDDTTSIVFGEGGVPLLDLVPPIDLRDPDAFTGLAPLLSWLLDMPGHRGAEAPRLDTERFGFQWATVSNLARLHQGREGRYSDLQETSRCMSSGPMSPRGERLCAVARFLAASRELTPQTCPRHMQTFRELEVETFAPLAYSVRIVQAECAMRDDPRRAASLVLDAVEYHPMKGRCELLNAVPFTPYLTGGSVEEQRLLALLDDFDLSECSEGANAIARRGQVQRELRQWKAAAGDFYYAYQRNPQVWAYLIAWAEMQLLARREPQEVDRLVDELRRDRFPVEVPDDVLPDAIAVMYLRWLIRPSTSARQKLLALYDQLPSAARILPDEVGDEIERFGCDDPNSLACRGGVPCTDGSLELMRGIKTDDGRAALASALDVP